MQTNEYQNFNEACNEFLGSKIILADVKISKILKVISNSKFIYNVIAENLINFDFNREFEKLTSKLKAGETLILPENSNFVIPFVFLLLVEIDSRHINLNQFIIKYFTVKSGAQFDGYMLFCNNIIIPFRNSILSCISSEMSNFDNYDSNTNEEKEEEKIIQQNIMLENKEEEMGLLFNRISRKAVIVKEKALNIKNELKKSNITIVSDAIIEGCKLENKKIVVALIMSLNLVAGHERIIKDEINEITQICYEFYN